MAPVPPIEQPPHDDEEPVAEEGQVVDPAVLADRRARRGVPDEGSLLGRLNSAEQDRALLATRLADVERTLEWAERERQAMTTDLERRERDLRSAQQREFAEQKRRVEAEDELVQARREANDELDRLRRELHDAEARVAEIGRELAHARRAPGPAEAERAHPDGQTALREERDRLATELDEARNALTLSQTALAGELRAAREDADLARRAAAEATSAHDALQDELRRRVELEDRVRGTIAQLRDRIEDVQARETERAEREAAVEALVAELVEASAELRCGFERELAATRERLWAEEDEQRARFAAELASIEIRVSGLRTQLGAVAAELRGELEVEQTARRLAEGDLARERIRHDVDQAGRDACTGDVSRLRAAVDERIEAQDRVERALKTVGAELAEVRRTAVEAEASRADAAAAAAAAAEMVEVARATQEPTTEEPATRSGPPDAAATDEAAAPAVRDPVDPDRERHAGPPAEVAGPGAELDGHTASLIEDLQRAADRLRAQVAEAETHEHPDGGAPAVPDAVDAVAPAPTGPAAPVAGGVGGPTPDAPEHAAGRARTPTPVIELEVVESRRTAGPTRSPWLADVVTALAAEDASLAAGAVETLLPALAARARHRVVFDLICEDVGEWRVALGVGRADVMPRPSGPGVDLDFAVAGPLAAVLPLVCGGADRRLAGAEVSGRKRRLRRLLKDLRQPLGLPELALSGVSADTGVLLDLLVRGLPPGALGDAPMIVDYDVAGQAGGRWHVTVRDGRATIAPGPAATTPTATVHVSDRAVAALLAGAAGPPGEQVVLHGAHTAVERLHGAFDVVQGQA